MSTLVGVFACSHAPGITGFPERATEAQRLAVQGAFAEVRERIDALRPDVIVAVSVEHFSNFFLNNLPAFAMGTAASYEGPITAEMGTFLQVPQRRHSGDPALGQHLYEHALGSSFDPALVAGDFAFDENFNVPLSLLDPAGKLTIVPVIVNGVNPPWPTLARCVDFGRMLRRGVEADGTLRRVVVLATGGLSHWVGMPESGSINQQFDDDFLSRLSSGDLDGLVRYDRATLDAAGNGAHEIRTWLVAAGAANCPFDVLAYEAVPAWLTDTAVAAARMTPLREATA